MEKVSVQYGNTTLTIETGKMAKQADGAVVVRYGDTVVLTAAVAAREPKEGTDFFPLTVDYREKTYAAGKIPGGYFKREGKPTEREILVSRLTDRPLRPMFPENFYNEVSITSTVLSVDGEHPTDVPTMVGASAALMLSGVPFLGPIGAICVGYVNDQFVVNPSPEQSKLSKLDLVLAGTEQQVVMIEAGACELSEEKMLQAIEFGHKELQKTIVIQKELKKKCGKPDWKVETKELPEDILKKVAQAVKGKFDAALCHKKKEDQSNAVKELYKSVLSQFDQESDDFCEASVKAAFQQLEYERVREIIVRDKKRTDGRKFDEIRAVACEVGLLPRTHGSALFTRGETQALCVATLGTKDDEQTIDSLEGDITKRFMLHYNFPSFSVNESKPNRGPGRREIGHGALAERALESMLPGPDQFPYTIRLVSDILESNGSSSMATVCGGTLALMDAGVPIESPVAGIAMGLVKEGNDFAVLTDIAGVEDHLGDMDFKVAGTKKGITALQMDIKITGVTHAILKQALEDAHKARLKLLDIMNKTIQEPRKELSNYAPRITTLQINPEKIKDIIGPGGKIIKSIIAETGVTIDIDDSGKVLIGSTSAEAAKKALDRIGEIVQEAEVGKIYNGKVRKIMPFGAFCEILPGMDGLVHVSELADKYVAKVEDVVKVGDIIPVKVINIDQQGKISLSVKKAKSDQPSETSA